MNVFELFGSIAIKGGDDANRQIDNLDKGGKRASSSVGRLEKASALAGKAMKIAFIGAAAAIGLLAVGLTKAVKEAADLEQITVAYEVLIGDVEKAGKVINDIKKASAKTPFQFKDLAKQGQTLMAFGIEADIVVDKMMMLGDVSMGNSVKMESIVRAYGKIQAKGKASLEELNMLTENGVPILEALSDQYEVTTAEMFKMITAGVVGFADVDQAIQTMTSEGGKFYGMLDKQSKTFTGRISTLKDNIQMLFAEVGSKLLPVIGPVIDKFTTKIKTALEELTDGKGPLARFTEVIVKIIAWAVNNIPKIGRTFQFVGEVAGIVADGIKVVWDQLAATVQGIIESLGIDKAVGVVFDVAVKFIGDTYAAIKKGIDTGDWSDLFGKAIDLSKVLITIYAGILLAKNITAIIGGLFSAISAAFIGTQFLTTISGIGIGGVVAGVALAVTIADTIMDPEKGWGAFATNVGIALMGAFAAGVITKSSKTGFYVFSILVQLNPTKGIDWAAKWKKIGDDFDANWSVTKANIEMKWDAFWEKLGEDIWPKIKQGIKNAAAKIDLVGYIIDWITGKNKEPKEAGKEVGSEFVEGTVESLTNVQKLLKAGKELGEKLGDGIESAWSVTITNALMWGSQLIESIETGITESIDTLKLIGSNMWAYIKDGFGDAFSLGEDIIQRLIDGFNAGKQRIFDLWDDIWSGIKGIFKPGSPSKEAEQLGEDIDAGLVNGFNNGKQKIIDWWDNLWNEDIKWGIFGSHSIPREPVYLGQDIDKGFAKGLANNADLIMTEAEKLVSDFEDTFKDSDLEPGFIAQLVEAYKKWIEAITAPGTMDAQAIIDNILGKTPEKTGEDAAEKLNKGFFGKLFDKIKEKITEIGQAFKDLDDDVFGGIFGKIGDYFKSVFGGIFSGLMNEIIAANPDLGAAITAFQTGSEAKRKKDKDDKPIEGMTASMLTGGIQAFIVSLATGSEEFQNLMKSLEPVITKLVNLFGLLITPLLPLVNILSKQLEPLMKMLEPMLKVVGEVIATLVLMLMQLIPPAIAILEPILQAITWTLEKLVMPILKFLYKAIALVYNGIANSINWLVTAINKVPFINIKWRMPNMEGELPGLPEPPAAEEEETAADDSTTGNGGRQISEITGPTRDLLVDLLTPLARLDSLTSIGNRIYDLLDERLVPRGAGVNIENLTIYGDNIDPILTARQIEEALGENIDFAQVGNL